jgi:hypothetical protein
MAHPFPQAFEHAERARHGPIPSPRLTSTPNAHHDPRWLPNDAAACHKPTRVPNSTQAPQTCPSAVTKAHEHARCAPMDPPAPPRSTRVPNGARRRQTDRPLPPVPRRHKTTHVGQTVHPLSLRPTSTPDRHQTTCPLTPALRACKTGGTSTPDHAPHFP